MSVAFGAPIGGVLFSLEEVSTNAPSCFMLLNLEINTDLMGHSACIQTTHVPRRALE